MQVTVEVMAKGKLVRRYTITVERSNIRAFSLCRPPRTRHRKGSLAERLMEEAMQFLAARSERRHAQALT